MKRIPAKIQATSETKIAFENDNIANANDNDKLRETLVNSLEREKRKNRSDNVTWAWRRQFRDGKFSFGYSSVLGFKSPDDASEILAIDEDEAETVRRIYEMFLDGYTYSGIARAPTEEGVKTPSGTADVWYSGTVKSMLQNEKYSGNAILQKSISEAPGAKKRLPNVGQAPQYRYSGTHKAIIEVPVFELVQSEIRRRQNLGRKLRQKALLSCRVICGECGELYVSEDCENGNNPMWQCRAKEHSDSDTVCKSPALDERTVKTAIVTAFNQLRGSRERLLADASEAAERLTDTTKLDCEITEAKNSLTELKKKLRDLIRENARTALNQEEYADKFRPLSKEFDAKKERLAELEIERGEHIAERERLRQFAEWVASCDTQIREFNLLLWYATVDVIIADIDGGLTFRFKDDSEVSVSLRS